MARAASSQSSGVREVRHRKRPGIHSKKRVSKLKSSKLYVKLYRGQGK